MNKLQLEQLIRVYNTLTTISTKGEDTLIMAECLNTLKPLLLQLQQQIQENIVNDIKE